LHDKGLRLRGALITGPLDLQGCDLVRDISLSHCRMTDPMGLVNASLRGLHLSGCYMAGISADNASFSGSLYIRAGSHVSGEISQVSGSVFLGNYPYSDTVTTLTTTGLLFFSSARVAHDFFLTNTEISLPDTPVVPSIFGATEEHGGDMALSLARAKIGGIFYLKDNQISRGIVNLAGAHVERLKDEPIGPGAAYPIRLDGFQYSDFSRHTDTNIQARLEWLERRPPETPFVAQPYEQLAYVLTRLGHRNDARTVLMRKEALLMAENRRLSQVWARFSKKHGPRAT